MWAHAVVAAVLLAALLAREAAADIVSPAGGHLELPSDVAVAGSIPEVVQDSMERTRENFYSQCRAQGIADPESFVGGRLDRAMHCVQDNIDVEEIVQDISRHMENGELDVLFSTRCRDLPPRILNCVEQPLVELERCLNETERAKNYSATLMAALREAVDFLCFNDGERIAIFLGEKGRECMSSQQVRDSLTHCLEKHNLTVSAAPDVLDSSTRGFTPAFCRRMFVMHDCAADALRLCDDPTPSNVVDSLLRAFEKPLPCRRSTSPAGPPARAAGLAPLLLFCCGALLLSRWR